MRHTKPHIAILLASSLSLSALGVCQLAVPVFADASKVVCIGSDLTEEEKTLMRYYFGISDDNSVQTIYVTNQDEVDHLSGYIPREQIGTRTVSCAYINPTESGGIKVKTANLQYVTANMIASTLADLGIQNCEVVSACPFQVSGTGALTGIIMAYETATGQTIDTTKKEIATQEVVVTKDIAKDVGNIQAEYIIGQTKQEALEKGLTTPQEIKGIVTDIASKDNIQISDTQVNNIINLTQNIVNQNYGDTYITNVTEINNNIQQEIAISNDINIQVETEEETEKETKKQTEAKPQEPAQTEPSILSGVNDHVLGENVIVSDTTDPSAIVQSIEQSTEQTETPQTETVDFGWTEETNTQTEETERQTETIQTELQTEVKTESAEQQTESEPVTEQATERVTEPATEPVTESVTKQPAETATEAVTERMTEPTTEPATELTTEQGTEPATEPVSEQGAESTTEPATEAVTEPVIETQQLTELYGYNLTTMAPDDAGRFVQMEAYCSQKFPYAEGKEADADAASAMAQKAAETGTTPAQPISEIAKTILDTVYAAYVEALVTPTPDAAEQETEPQKTLEEQLQEVISQMVQADTLTEQDKEEVLKAFNEILHPQITEETGILPETAPETEQDSAGMEKQDLNIDTQMPLETEMPVAW